MARTPLVRSATFDAGTFLIHGAYGSGKTHLLGDALRTEGGLGPVRFINLRGEDGYSSIEKEITDDAAGETVDTFDDLEASLLDAKKAGARLIAIDGLHRLYPLTYKKVLGSDRLPVVGGQTNEWSGVHKAAETLIEGLRYHAPIVVCTSATDKSLDQIRNETHITPNFPGRNAAGIAGFFDFVFYMESEVLGANKIKRTLRTAPVSKMVVRYRLPKPLPASLDIPDGPGGWSRIVDAINASLKPKSTP